MSKLSEAIKLTRENDYLNENTEEGIQVFIALYGMLGMEELYDGICSAMQDEGHEEVYEDIIMYYEDDEESHNDGSNRYRD